MKYVFLIYRDETPREGHGSGSRDADDAEAAAYREQLRLCGQLLMALELPPTALTVRAPGGALELRDDDGSLAIANLSAIWLAEARDLNEAIRLAARMPGARSGHVEVRPLIEEECDR